MSVIVGRVTEQGVAEMLRPRLLAPLGLPDIPWHRDPLGRELGFSGAHLTTEAIASIAQLYLDHGRWEGRQLLSPAWVAEATVGFGPRNEDPPTPPDWARGYGYSFWMQRYGYRGDGAYGQFLAVLPEHDLVVAITVRAARHAGDARRAVGARRARGRTRRVRSRPMRSSPRCSRPSRSRRWPAVRSGRTTPSSPGRRPPTSPTTTPPSRSPATAAGTCSVWRAGGSGCGCRSPPVRGWSRPSSAGGATLPVVSSGGWVDEDVFRAEVIAIETPHRFRVEARLRGGDADLTWRMVPLTGSDPLWLSTRWA